MKKIFYRAATLFGLIFTLASCQVGLGQSVDLTAPKISVVSPERYQSVTNVLIVEGTASDNLGIEMISVEVKETNQKFRCIKSGDKMVWEEYRNGEWSDFPNGICEGTATELNWSLEFNVLGAETGENYTIWCEAFDNHKNRDKDSRDERTVTADLNPPVVNIITPATQKSFIKAQQNFYDYTLKDKMVLVNLINGNFTVSGSQREDTRLGVLKVTLCETNAENSEDTELLAKVLNVNTDSGDGSVIKTLRNWSFDVKADELPESVRTGKHLLKIKAESYDTAGNMEPQDLGWFIYWNEADLPWIEAGFGVDSWADLTGEGNGMANLYPGSPLYVYAYDDDGIGELSATIYKLNDSGIEESRETKFDNSLESKKYPNCETWFINAPVKSGNYKIEFTVKDNTEEHKTIDQNVVRYISVSDVKAPEVFINQDTDQNSLFGDQKGYYTLSGSVVDDDKDNEPELTLVWVKDKENLSRYVDPDFVGWTNDISSKTGDKRFILPLTQTEEQKKEIQYKADFGFKFNLFNDSSETSDYKFNFSTSNKYERLNFVLKAKDSGNQSTIKFYSFSGDYTKPSLDITSMKVDGEEKIDVDLLSPYQRNSSGISSRIVFSGTWNDDSCRIGDDTTGWIVSDGTVIDYNKIGKVKLLWSDGSNVKEYSVNMKPDGTWVSESIIPPDSSTASVTVSLMDIGGNETSVVHSFNININEPRFVRISSDTPDGSYKEGDEVVFTMEFNKAVKFTEGKEPKLELNIGTSQNPVYADYKDGNGGSVHRFSYTVKSGDNIDKLNVTAIKIQPDCIWVDSQDGVTRVKNIDLSSVQGTADALDGNREISLDTRAPDFSIRSQSKGWFVKDKELFFFVSFSEDVNFIGNPEDKDTGIRLTFEAQDNDQNPVTVLSTETTQSGSKSLIIKYKIGDINAEPLVLKDIDFGSVVVTDKAGNPLVLDSNRKREFSSSENAAEFIFIDNSIPKVPVINLKVTDGNTDRLTISENGRTYYIDEKQYILLTIDDFESRESTQKMYSIDNGRIFSEYTSPVKIPNNGSYTILAYQKDAAGNRIDAVSRDFIIDKRGKVVESITADKPNGTYTTNDKIEFIINFRKRIKLTNKENTYLVINVSNPDDENSTTSRKVQCDTDEGIYTSELRFTYIVKEGDSCDNLRINNVVIDAQIQDESNTVINSSLLEAAEGTGFESNRNSMKIITGRPVLEYHNWDPDSMRLTLYYSSAVTRDPSKNIFVAQVAGNNNENFRVPSILKEDDFNMWNDKNDVDLLPYYSKGTSGTSKPASDLGNYTPVSDTQTKYILKWDYENNSKDVVDEFVKAGYFSNTVSMGSSYIDVSNSRNSVSVTYEDESGTVTKDLYPVIISFNQRILPVKGVSYLVTLDEGIVKDDQKNVSEKDSSGFTIKTAGVQNPEIRLNKKSGGLIKKSNGSFTNEQPLTIDVKFDCQTPGAYVCYDYDVKQGRSATAKKPSSGKTIWGTSLPVFTFTVPKFSEFNESLTDNTKTISKNFVTSGTVVELDPSMEKRGAGILIAAKSFIGEVKSLSGDKPATIAVLTSSETSFEAAYRTVIKTTKGYKDGLPSLPGASFTQMWIRGGDAPGGDVLTPGFPLSFNTRDTTGNTTRAMENGGDGDNYWYWYSWEIATPLYPQFALGDVPDDAVEHGPLWWVKASQGFVRAIEIYPVYPGTMVTFESGASGYGDDYTYQLKHVGKRVAVNDPAVEYDGY